MSAAGFLPADWSVPAGIIAGTSLRHGGVSQGAFESLNLGTHVGDAATDVAENRRRFLANCDLPDRTLWLDQVHGSSVALDPEIGTVPQADAAVSTQANTTCVVLTADCLPVLFASRNGNAVGAAHAGWRGLLSGVLEATVAAFGDAPEDLLVWLGPAISQAAFEVGGEVRQAFLDEDADTALHFAANSRGRWQADLYGLARQRLARSGVSQITGGNHCTLTESARWFSYRRDGQCGRMASFVCRGAKALEMR